MQTGKFKDSDSAASEKGCLLYTSIEDQEKHDIALDKLSVKEYEDPFKGSK